MSSSSQSTSFGSLDALAEVYSRDDDEVMSHEETEEEREMRLMGTLVPTEELLRDLGIYHDHHHHHDIDDSSSKEVIIQKKKRSPRRPRQNFAYNILGDNDVVKRELKLVMEEEVEEDFCSVEEYRKRNTKKRVMEEEAEEDYYSVEKSRKRKRNTKKKSRSRKLSRTVDLKNYVAPEPAPPLPDNVRATMEEDGPVEGEPTLVLQRILNPTDLSISHNRLAIPTTQIVDKDFLTGDEKNLLHEKKIVYVSKKSKSKKKKKNGQVERELVCEDKRGSIDTYVILPSLNIDKISMKCWKMTNKYMYALNNTWNKLLAVEEDRGKQLLPGMVLQIWAYRIRGLLRFALVNLGTFLKQAESPVSNASSEKDSIDHYQSQPASSSEHTSIDLNQVPSSGSEEEEVCHLPS